MSSLDDGEALLTRLLAFRSAFINYGMPPPTSIMLKNSETGKRFLALTQQTHVSTTAVPVTPEPVEMADGEIYMRVAVFGMHITWPASRRARSDGTWSFE